MWRPKVATPRRRDLGHRVGGTLRFVRKYRSSSASAAVQGGCGWARL
jgi:hypothetical protein